MNTHPARSYFGVISDTHGLVRPELPRLLAGCRFILHGGDITDRRTLEELETIAPVLAVQGNCDTGPFAARIPLVRTFSIPGIDGGNGIMVHRLNDLPFRPESPGYRLVVFGHSHRPVARWEDGVLYLNPGSAGRRRFSLPVTCAVVRISENGLEPELITIVPGKTDD